MKHFNNINAESFEQASRLLKESGGKMDAMAGGTDLLGAYKDEILPVYPETVLNLKTIPGFDKFEDREDCVVIGAGCKLNRLAEHEVLKKEIPALAEAAYSVASPLIRSAATIGGNICQDVRCWYYRYPDSVGGKLVCKRKGGNTCYAINGENRYHSIFGGMKLHGSSCTKECPAGTDIPGYMAKLRAGDWNGAAEIIMKYNPMPMLTSRICPHVCQNECNQCTYGDCVNIHGVERSLGDYIMENKAVYFAAPSVENGKKAVVVGAGPGGLAAAYYLRKAGNQVDVYDKMEKAGGVLRYGIPHYRLPKTLVDAYSQALADMGICFHMGVEVGKDISVETLREQCDTMYFGTGAWKQPVLGLQGEHLTEFGLNFLVEVNTYLEKAIGNNVLVCGGGNVAMDVALSATRLGAKNVKLVCLEQRNEMPASSEEIAMAEEEGVQIYNGWGLGKVLSDENGKVCGLEAMRCTSVRDENGRFAPKYDESDRMTFDSDYIILATGQRVDLEFLGEKLAGQLKSGRGLIDADLETLKTKMEGIYAGGDAVTGPDIAIRAIRAGRVAAANMNRDLGIITKPESVHEKYLHFDVDGIEPTIANKLPERPASERTLAEEDRGSFTQEEALDEARRCMNCGCYAVNASDITPVLVMLGAEIITTERTISAKELFTAELDVRHVLHEGELVKEIMVPKAAGVMHYDKRRVRNAIDFAIVSLASRISVNAGVVEDVRLVLGGVAPVPYELPEVEAFLRGKKIDAEVATEAAELALKDADAMKKNGYKVMMAKDVVYCAIMRVAE